MGTTAAAGAPPAGRAGCSALIRRHSSCASVVLPEPGPPGAGCRGAGGAVGGAPAAGRSAARAGGRDRPSALAPAPAPTTTHLRCRQCTWSQPPRAPPPRRLWPPAGRRCPHSTRPPARSGAAPRTRGARAAGAAAPLRVLLLLPRRRRPTRGAAAVWRGIPTAGVAAAASLGAWGGQKAARDRCVEGGRDRWARSAGV
jgi:hypothetical protein